MKATQANIDANQRTITQAGVNREEFEKNIKNDRSISDEHMRSAAMKFAKNEKLDTKEIELVMKWL